MIQWVEGGKGPARGKKKGARNIGGNKSLLESYMTTGTIPTSPTIAALLLLSSSHAAVWELFENA
jgi:hypothetical protein